jgi:hypothetical protein
MSNLSEVSLHFQEFLKDSGFIINFINNSDWNIDHIPKVMMIALRSQIDMLSGTYQSYNDFIIKINKIKIDDKPVPSRGEVMSIKDWDNMVLYFENANKEFPFSLTTLPKSRNLYKYTRFLESLGMNSHDGYLETRSWFCRNAELQLITLKVVLQGNGSKIDVFAPDYREHITDLLHV